MAASYLLGILGYGLGMALSLLGHVPAGLLALCAAGLLAAALFRNAPKPEPGARPG